MGSLGLVLFYTAWKIFQTEDLSKSATQQSFSETEIKIMQILEEIDGVGEANVAVCETEDGVQSVVVVCDGAKNIQVVMNVREAVAAALNTSEKAVKIYLKKD